MAGFSWSPVKIGLRFFFNITRILCGGDINYNEKAVKGKTFDGKTDGVVFANPYF